MGLLDAIVGAATGKSESQTTRLGKALYTPPSGKGLAFLWEEVEGSRTARGKAHDFVGVDGSYVQSLGRSGRVFPVAMLFSGPDADLQMRAMLEALDETGVGTLDHPVFGRCDVVPLGEVKGRANLVTGVHECRVEVTFFETLRGAYPSISDLSAGDVVSAYDALLSAQAAAFAGGLKTPTVAALQEAKADFRSTMRTVSRALSGASDAVTEASAPMGELERNIDLGLDTLIGQPLALAEQVQALTATPGATLARLSAAVEGYQDQALGVLSALSSLVLGETTATRGGSSTPYRAGNGFATSDLAVVSAVGAAASTLGVVRHRTREAAVAAVALVLDTHETARKWREATLQTTGNDGGLSGLLSTLVATAASLALRESFALPRLRWLLVDRDRTPIDLVWELTGSLDGLDDFLAVNSQLPMDRGLLLRRGDRVRVYA